MAIVGFNGAGTVSRRLAISSDSSGQGSVWMQRVPAPSWPPGNHYEVDALGAYIWDGQSAQQARMALYSGTSAPETLIAEVELSHGDGNYQLYDESVASSGIVPSTGYLWIVIKGAQTGTDDNTSTSFGVYDTTSVCNGLTGCTFDSGAKYVADISGAGGGTAFSDPWDYGTLDDFNPNHTFCLWADLIEVEGVPPIGSGAATIPAIEADGVGYVSVTGTAAASFGSLFASASGSFGSVIIPPQVASVVHYKALLSADGESDYEIPISSFELRLRESPLQCYLSVIVPAILNYIDEISSRIDGELSIYQVLDGADTELLTANIEDIRQFQGGRSRSGAISAYKQITYGPATTRELSGSSYRAVSDGVTRHRLLPRNIYPGDTAVIGGDTIVVDSVTWSVSPVRSTMEIAGS
jgi:hypothetical protein